VPHNRIDPSSEPESEGGEGDSDSVSACDN
jgi:hypothetical protein